MNTVPRLLVVSFTYDGLGNMLTETDPVAHVRSWAYDLAGQNTSYTDGRSIAQAYAYDAAGRQTGVAYPGGSVAYGYDVVGRETSMLDATGTTTRTYDAASRVTSVASPQGTVAYTYNTAGQRASMTLPGSRTVSYGYDSGGRLSTLTDWLTNVTSFTYDNNSRRTVIVHPNGVTSAYAYDAANRNTSITHTGPSGALLAFANSYDANGNRTSVTKNGGTPETYTLDTLNRLTSVTYADGTTQSYTYDANGNRITKTQGGATTTYTYNGGERLVSDGTSTYAYDAAGNLTARGSDTFSYDYASRMTAATVAGASSTYAYDGDDVRTSVTAGGTTSPQLWDRVCSQGTCGPSCGASCGQVCGQSGQLVPLLVDDSSNTYLWADGLVAEVATSGARLDDLGDGLGSIRGWTNATGTLASSADYDAFGSVRASSGSPGAFRYTGEQWDSATGFEFLRARYYDPTLGRFTSADTVQPNASGTQGWNLYAYVANNPTTWTDPTGRIVRPPTIRQPTATEYALLAMAGLVAAGGLQPLGPAIRNTFQLLADVFWMLAQPGRAAFNVWRTVTDEHAENCAAEYRECIDRVARICENLRLSKAECKALKKLECEGNYIACISGVWPPISE